VANQIAAGEVVERPASVVKELIENSLDAGATRIVIELEDAGSTLVAVVDDGEGMSPADAVASFERHATSKLRGVADLERIATLGFRGEALASIAAVARVTLVTRRAQDLAATCVLVQHGNVADVRETGAPAGTRIEVADLFGNTPARRKFLKTPATEVGHVTELVTRTALAWPQVGFTLLHGGRRLLELASVREDEERVRQVFGDERSLAMMSFTGRNAAGYTCGWLSNSHLTFPSPRQIYTYVNRRYVRDKLVTHALLAGYSTLLMHGRYPGAVVFLDINFDEVDVNVHPAKSEVRFRRGGAVHELLAQAVQARLRDQEEDRPQSVLKTPAPLFPFGDASLPEGLKRPLPPPLRLVERFPESPAQTPGAATVIASSSAETHHPSPKAPPAAGFFSSLRVVGQVFGGYLVCENASSMIVIDQHAAHERVMFERLRAAYSSGAIPRQQLLVPAVVDVGARAATLLCEQLDDLADLGFEIEAYGGSSFAVRAVPALLGDADPSLVLRDLAEDLVEVGRSRRVDQAAEDVLARLACHSAVRVGQGLQGEQIRALLAGMDRIDFSGNCPHGRPAYLTFGRGELERWFKRT
jgi:DNA mismatch repair protein MutL